MFVVVHTTQGIVVIDGVYDDFEMARDRCLECEKKNLCLPQIKWSPEVIIDGKNVTKEGPSIDDDYEYDPRRMVYDLKTNMDKIRESEKEFQEKIDFINRKREEKAKKRRKI